MELLNKKQSQRDFLKTCEKFVKKYPSKNITGECANCFIFYIQEKYNFKDYEAFVKNYDNYTDCYKIASFLQDAGLIKIKNGIDIKKFDDNKTTYSIDCWNFSFLNSFGKNKI